MVNFGFLANFRFLTYSNVFEEYCTNDSLFFQIYNEADLDNDQSLSFAEFEHVITKAPDFVK